MTGWPTDISVHLTIALTALILLSGSQSCLAQSDYLDQGRAGARLGLSFASYEDYNGGWLTNGYSPDGRFDVGGNFGWLRYSSSESIWVFAPHVSYILAKPYISETEPGGKLTGIAQFHLVESDYLNYYNLNATDRALKLLSEFYTNFWVSRGVVIQPGCAVGVSFERFKIWNIYGYEETSSERNGVIDLHLRLFIETSPLNALEFLTGFERSGDENSFWIGLSMISDRSDKD